MRNNPNVERALIALVAVALGAVTTYLGLDVQAICEAVVRGG